MVKLTEVELDDLVILQWIGAQDEDVPNHSGIAISHPTILSEGAVCVEIEGQEPEILYAPAVILFPLKTSYNVRSIVPRSVVHCIYNKLVPGAIEDIALVRSLIHKEKD